MNTRPSYTRLGRTLAAATWLAVLLLFIAVPRSQADGRAQCQRNIERAETRLDYAVHKYGGNSKQTIARWHELNAERERCYNLYHAWWNPGEHQWVNGREWGRYDEGRGWRFGP